MSERTRFTKTKEESLIRPGVVQVVYKEVDKEQTPTGFRIYAEAAGISLGESDLISTAEQLDELAYFISEAWKSHKELQRGVRSKLGLIN